MGNYQIPPWRCPMTQPHPQPQRCIHECVCHSYLDYQSDDLDPCLAKKCEHDTRTHTPAAPATEPEIKTCPVNPLAFADGCTGCTSQESFICTIFMQMLLQKRIKAEREKVLEWAKKHNWPTTGGHRVIGFDKLKEFLESLRGGGAP